MSRIPRRLRSLNIPEQASESVQPDEENLEGPPEIDDLVPKKPPDSTRQIKIIWPNGDVRQIIGEFRGKNLSELRGGKIIVETDENGIPNDRSAAILGQHLTWLAENSTFAPLHIPRWDNELFLQKHGQMITDVEEKFIYPNETRQLTRDGILLTINKKWRAYKSRLKSKYFKRDKKSLAEIIAGVPKGVNEHQWDTLVGFWCQESHMKLCVKNTECAKKQKNPHTTGRKSHARLRKMEIRSNRKVSKIELWDEAHKQKDGEYKNAKTKIVMEKLEERKKDNNGSLSFSDYTEVFESVHGEEAKNLRGYYGDKYWTEIKVSQGLTFVQHPEKEGNVQFALRALGDNVENVTDELAMICSFLKRKFPTEDLRNEYVTAGSDEVDLNKRVARSDLPNESNKKAEEHAPLSAMKELHRSNCVRAKECYTGLSLPQEKKKAYIEKSDRANQEGAESTLPNEQITNQELHPSFSARTKEYYTGLSLPHMVAKKAHIETFDKANQGRAESTKEGYTNQGSAESTLPNKHITAQELHTSFSLTTKEDYTGSSLPHRVAKKAHIEKFDRVNQGCAESTLLDKTDQELHHSDCARTKEGCTRISSPHEHTVAKKAHDGPESKNGHAENINATKQGGLEPSVQLHRITKQGKLKVLLVSLNPRSKNKFVAEGTLVSRDKTYVVGGNMLGEQYVAVSVCAVSRLGDDTLVRPHGKLQTVRDAIGHVIAWPLSHVKKGKLTTSAQPRNKPPNTG